MPKKNKNNFLQIDINSANNLAAQFGTPLFMMDEKGMLNRFHTFQHAIKQRYSHSLIAVSYKTNFLKGLLTLLHNEGAHAEVVSGIEYTVAKEIRSPGQKIVFNGPMKTQNELIEAIKDNAIINCDHEDEIFRIEQLAKIMQRKVSIGIRIYFQKKDNSWNRFGFCVQKDLSDQSTINLIKRIIESPHLKLAGLHTHIGTNIRELHHFSQLGQYLNEFATALKKKFHIELDWIDVGGGLAGISPYIKENRIEPHPLPDLEAYTDAIINPLLPYLHSLPSRPLLIFEPGRTLFEAYGALLTRVIGRRPKDADGLRAYVCDAGINTLSTSYVYDFPIHVFSDTKPHKKTQLFGPTCNQQDHIHSPIVLPNLKPDDLILFYGIGSYCMAFSYSFIRFRPGVILWRGSNHSEWLRKQETLEHHAALECIPSRTVNMESATC